MIELKERPIFPRVVVVGLVLGLSACTNPYDPVQRTIGGHQLLLGLGDGAELLTDLLTVFFGLGVFSANAAVTYRKAAQGWTAEPVGERISLAFRVKPAEGAQSDPYR